MDSAEPLYNPQETSVRILDGGDQVAEPIQPRWTGEFLDLSAASIQNGLWVSADPKSFVTGCIGQQAVKIGLGGGALTKLQQQPSHVTGVERPGRRFGQLLIQSLEKNSVFLSATRQAA